MAPSPSPTAIPPAHHETTVSPLPDSLPDASGVQGNLTISFAGPDARRPSIQFATDASEGSFRNESPRSGQSKSKSQRRLSSPPPPSTYENRVSFDTFDNRDATDFSFTLKSKHRHYAYTKRSRTFLCGTDQNDYSDFALEWLLDELVDDGDEVVCLRVVDKDSKITSGSSVEEGRYRTEAYKLLEQIKAKNKDDEKSISLVLEFAVGKVQDTFQRMISIYEPSCLIVGTRGRSLGGIQGLLPGSVSKYCLQNSPVPVIVVRPSSKREKKKAKRRADPNRRAYMDILGRSRATGSQIFDKIENEKPAGQTNEEAEKEAKAVAEAIGLPDQFSMFDGFTKPSDGPDPGEGAPLVKVTSTKSDYTSGPDSPSSTGGLSPDGTFQGELRSPELGDLGSPELSEDEAERQKGMANERKSSVDAGK